MSYLINVTSLLREQEGGMEALKVGVVEMELFSVQYQQEKRKLK